jgi:hypothetical protein
VKILFTTTIQSSFFIGSFFVNIFRITPNQFSPYWYNLLTSYILIVTHEYQNLNKRVSKFTTTG